MKIYLAIFAVIISSLTLDARLTFSCGENSVVTIDPDASTGLEAVYVVRDVAGVSISTESGTPVSWSRFGNSGAAYAESLGTSVSVSLNDEDCGYVVEVDGRPQYYWIINYAGHAQNMTSLSVADGGDCNRIALNFVGQAERIDYRTINGRSVELDREYKLSYNTLEYDSENQAYRQIECIKTLAFLSPDIYVDAPLCDTRFAISGDRFSTAWGVAESVESDMCQAVAVTAETSAEQHRREVDNEQRVDGNGLGGSAPCDIDFHAAVSDAATFYEWQFSRSVEFDPIDDRYNSTDLQYTFDEQGTTYVRFYAADASGNCDFTGPVYEVNIGESNILCPNAFTPESSPGVNDEWKVSYKSIISFECHIFNRWGTEMFSFDDPSKGWDGKYKGKFVPAGVYYYVIKAKGADGRDYKLSGDINIIKAKTNSVSNTEQTY